uniref:Uncharacterized protein n=1 Tax=Ananas comosus var. bracteatus TaxID=296719 RepID=A0A6V7Q9I6_ANACO|nr:unnamed protein product [Ananas comosus var. bracteatus]
MAISCCSPPALAYDLPTKPYFGNLRPTSATDDKEKVLLGAEKLTSEGRGTCPTAPTRDDDLTRWRWKRAYPRDAARYQVQYRYSGNAVPVPCFAELKPESTLLGCATRFRYLILVITVYRYTAQTARRLLSGWLLVPVREAVYRYTRVELGVSLISGFGGFRSIQQVVPQLRGFFAAGD